MWQRIKASVFLTPLLKYAMLLYVLQAGIGIIIGTYMGIQIGLEAIK